MTNERRAAFLAGEGVLTAQEVREWAAVLAPHRGLPTLPAGMSSAEPLMVSVANVEPPDTRGLTGATIHGTFGR